MLQRVPHSLSKGVIDYPLNVSDAPVEYTYSLQPAARNSRHERDSFKKHHRAPSTAAPTKINSEEYYGTHPGFVSRLTSGPENSRLPNPFLTTKTPTFPHLQRAQTATQTRPLSSGDIQSNSTSFGLSRTNSNPLTQRSPSRRKPPASHSSYGIGTNLGPPPSFITQRSRSSEKIWSVDRAKFVRVSATGEQERAEIDERHSQKSLPVKHQIHEVVGAEDFPAYNPYYSNPDTVNGHSAPAPKEKMSLTPPTLAGSFDGSSQAEYSNTTAYDVDGKRNSSEGRRSEDLFLNIARADAAPRPGLQSSRSDRRRTRTSLPSIASNYRITSLKSPSHGTTPQSDGPRQSYSNNAGQVTDSINRDYFDEVHSMVDERLMRRDSDARSTSRSIYSRQNTNSSQDYTYLPQRTGTIKPSRLGMDTTIAQHQRMNDHIATESTVSTTAPSTVWDELDDLKSRIRKLELTGKLPPSSAAAMNLADRPRTATTAATTMSLSPKQHNLPTTTQSMVEGVSPLVHPLLHEALANAKTTSSPDVYHKLLATAQDALQLTTILNNESLHGITGLPSAVERQIRRRTESMCRSLTELAIALSAESRSVASPPTLPPKRESSQLTASGLRTRRLSGNSPDRAPVSYRTHSRLETRRSTGSATLAPAHRYATDHASNSSPIGFSDTQSYVSRPSRMNTVTRNSITRRPVDGANDTDVDNEPEGASAMRPFSRANTDIGTNRYSSRHSANISRDYTNRYPMPAQFEDNLAQTRSPTRVSSVSGLTIRRKHGISDRYSDRQSVTPVTPRENTFSAMPVPNSAGSEDASAEGGTFERSSSRRILTAVSRNPTVTSRLRAVRAERDLSRRESFSAPSPYEMTQSGPEEDFDNPRGESANDM